MSIGVDVVNGATVDSDRGEETSVGGSTGQISADISVFEKDRAARVAALDPAIQVIPLIDPADWSVRLPYFIEVSERFGECNLV